MRSMRWEYKSTEYHDSLGELTEAMNKPEWWNWECVTVLDEEIHRIDRTYRETVYRAVMRHEVVR